MAQDPACSLAGQSAIAEACRRRRRKADERQETTPTLLAHDEFAIVGRQRYIGELVHEESREPLREAGAPSYRARPGRHNTPHAVGDVRSIDCAGPIRLFAESRATYN